MTAIDPRELITRKILQIIKILGIGRIPPFGASTYPFTDYFKGFEKVQAIRRIFSEKTENILRNLKVELTWIPGYMWINLDGHLVVSSRYLSNGDKVDIYLDVIHELVHVKQFMEGRELFDIHYDYSERPTEIEAYRCAVQEARRLGLSDQRICSYLRTEWMSDRDFKRLASTLNVNCDEQSQS